MPTFFLLYPSFPCAKSPTPLLPEPESLQKPDSDFAVSPGLPQASPRRGSGSTPSCKAQEILTLVFLTKMTRGQRALPQGRAGQVDLFGKQYRNPFAEAQLYSTIET